MSGSFFLYRLLCFSHNACVIGNLVFNSVIFNSVILIQLIVFIFAYFHFNFFATTFLSSLTKKLYATTTFRFTVLRLLVIII